MARYRIAQRPHPESGACAFVYEVEEFDHFYLGTIKLPVGAWNYVDRFETKELAEAYISLLLRYSRYSKEYRQ